MTRTRRNFENRGDRPRISSFVSFLFSSVVIPGFVPLRNRGGTEI